jgi:hypothetical protein
VYLWWLLSKKSIPALPPISMTLRYIALPLSSAYTAEWWSGTPPESAALQRKSFRMAASCILSSCSLRYRFQNYRWPERLCAVELYIEYRPYNVECGMEDLLRVRHLNQSLSRVRPLVSLVAYKGELYSNLTASLKDFALSRTIFRLGSTQQNSTTSRPLRVRHLSQSLSRVRSLVSLAGTIQELHPSLIAGLNDFALS